MLFLKKSFQYKQIYKAHRRIRGQYFNLLYQLRKDEEEPAFGIIVSKKVGNAVIRNRIKRQLRYFLRIEEKHLSKNVAGIIIAEIGSAAVKWKDIHKDLITCLEQINLLTRY